LLECLTYRWYGHHEGDPGVAYRAKEEIAAWRERDPVKRLKDDAIADGTLAAADFDNVDTEVAAVLEDAAQFALASALEDESTALRHVFAE
jgi:TPP-dependent pyruvate/acetoin dehydrogenase alpha subunit